MGQGRLEIQKIKLIESLKKKGVKDERILEAISKIPREFFLSEELKARAYEDNALPIECGQTISQPYTVAYMTYALDVKRGQKILEIGTGSGYQSLILNYMGAEVYTIERIFLLCEKAKITFKKLGANINTKCGDGTLGWPEESPFDRIIVTAAAPDIPKKLIRQLKIGGRLVAPIGGRPYQVMNIITRASENNYRAKETHEFKFVPLIGEEGWN